MKNTNCLEGFRCPKCGQEDELLVEATMWVSLTDDGTDPYADSVDNMGGTEWSNNSSAMCPNCGCVGKIKKFFTEGEK